MVQLAVFEEAPKLHATHNICVVGAVLVTKFAVEVVNGAQIGDMSHNHKDHLQM